MQSLFEFWPTRNLISSPIHTARKQNIFSFARRVMFFDRLGFELWELGSWKTSFTLQDVSLLSEN